jgi:LuxR family maltose regulon positive regulatory protein
LSALELEWNMLESAGRSASQAFEIAQSYPDEELYVLSSLSLARLFGAQGELGKAQKQLESLISKVKRVFVIREAEVLQGRLFLRAGDLGRAQRWQDALAGQEGLPRYLEEQEALLAARVHLALGDAEKALGRLDGWLAEARSEGRIRSELEINMLMAMAHGTREDLAQALIFVVEALSLGQSLGFQRIFLDEGQPFARLLRAVLPRIEDGSLAAFARALLYTTSNEGEKPDAFLEGSSKQLVEPLSAQELRVLRLLAAGLSTPEIAGELVVSVNTAKTHVKNVYAKLGVNNRRQSRETARHLNLTK